MTHRTILRSASILGSMLANPPSAAAQGHETTIDVRPVAGTLGYARRVSPRRLVGGEVGFGAPQLELTLTPRGSGVHDLEEILHLGLFVRFVPSDRFEGDVGLRASFGGVADCRTNDCLPIGVFGGAYASAFYGRRRVKVGALVAAGRAFEPGLSTTVVNVSPLILRLKF